MILRQTGRCAIGPVNHLAVRGTLGTRQTLAPASVDVEKISRTATAAHSVPDGAARSHLRPARRAVTAFGALPPVRSLQGIVAAEARLAFGVAVYTARLLRPLSLFANAARNTFSLCAIKVMITGARLGSHDTALFLLETRAVSYTISVM